MCHKHQNLFQDSINIKEIQFTIEFTSSKENIKQIEIQEF